MIDIGKAWTEHLRIALLRVLEGAPEQTANESILVDAARAIGVSATRDQVRSQIAWLAEQGLAQYEDLGRLWLVRITSRGIDVALGVASHHGVKRPSPRP